jgi:hypothetical protein
LSFCVHKEKTCSPRMPNRSDASAEALPNLALLSINPNLNSVPTNEFYTFRSEEDAKQVNKDPFTQDVVPLEAFRLMTAKRSSNDDPIYNYFDPESLWNWVKEKGQAKNPYERSQISYNDWMDLHHRFGNPHYVIPYWVRKLQLSDRNWKDPNPSRVIAESDTEYKTCTWSLRLSDSIEGFLERTQDSAITVSADDTFLLLERLSHFRRRYKTNLIFKYGFHKFYSNNSLRECDLLVTTLFKLLISVNERYDSEMPMVLKGFVLVMLYEFAEHDLKYENSNGNSLRKMQEAFGMTYFNQLRVQQFCEAFLDRDAPKVEQFMQTLLNTSMGRHYEDYISEMSAHLSGLEENYALNTHTLFLLVRHLVSQCGDTSPVVALFQSFGHDVQESYNFLMDNLVLRNPKNINWFYIVQYVPLTNQETQGVIDTEGMTLIANSIDELEREFFPRIKTMEKLDEAVTNFTGYRLEWHSVDEYAYQRVRRELNTCNGDIMELFGRWDTLDDGDDYDGLTIQSLIHKMTEVLLSWTLMRINIIARNDDVLSDESFINLHIYGGIDCVNPLVEFVNHNFDAGGAEIYRDENRLRLVHVEQITDIVWYFAERIFFDNEGKATSHEMSVLLNYAMEEIRSDANDLLRPSSKDAFFAVEFSFYNDDVVIGSITSKLLDVDNLKDEYSFRTFGSVQELKDAGTAFKTKIEDEEPDLAYLKQNMTTLGNFVNSLFPLIEETEQVNESENETGAGSMTILILALVDVSVSLNLMKIQTAFDFDQSAEDSLLAPLVKFYVTILDTQSRQNVWYSEDALYRSRMRRIKELMEWRAKEIYAEITETHEAMARLIRFALESMMKSVHRILLENYRSTY